ncbi:MAG: ABC transporter ATP-binding protein [Candidatus Thermoplasmatota archaeon]
MANAIETDGLSRTFGAVRAVDGLRLRVRAGSVFGYLGPNGAGKTTTLHLLLGILQPTSGTAQVAGLDVTRQPEAVRRHCGALLEHNGLYERLSAYDNLDFAGRVHGLAKPDREARVKELLDAMGLWERRDDNVGSWSRGMKQRLAISRALLHRPQILFLDEPTAGFDPLAAAKLRTDIRDLVRESGTTVFLTTHNLHEAEEMCDEVAVLRSGSIVAQGRPDSLRSNVVPTLQVRGSGFTAPLLQKLRRRKEVAALDQRNGSLEIRLNGEAPAAPLVDLLVRGGASVEEVVRPRASLEDSFLAILEAKA